MHELSLAERVIEIVEGAARKAGAQQVHLIRLSVGALAHVEPETLQFCCELVSRDSIAAGARIEVLSAPGKAWCETCQTEIELEQVGMPCSHCGGFKLKITDGDQMQVLEIGVEPLPAP